MVHFNSCPRCGEAALYMPQEHGGGFICFRCGLKMDLDGKDNDSTRMLITKLQKEQAKMLKIIEDLKIQIAKERRKNGS